MKIAIVGAGLAGCVAARRLAEASCAVDVFEQRNRIGGLCADGYTEHGTPVQWHGPHIWHNDDPNAQAFVSRFTSWLPRVHQVWAWTGVQYVPIPINEVTQRLLRCGADQAVKDLYDTYTAKFWGPHAAVVREVVQRRVRVRPGTDCRYFTERWQGIPAQGWSAMLRRMLDHPNITVTQALIPHVDADAIASHDRIVWTGRLDAALDHSEGTLAFRTIAFEFGTLSCGNARPFAVVNHPTTPPDYFRETNYRRLLDNEHPLATVGYETACECTGRDDQPTHYIPSRDNERTRKRCIDALPDRVSALGRFGAAAYADMCEVVADALTLTEPGGAILF